MRASPNGNGRSSLGDGHSDTGRKFSEFSEYWRGRLATGASSSKHFVEGTFSTCGIEETIFRSAPLLSCPVEGVSRLAVTGEVIEAEVTRTGSWTVHLETSVLVMLVFLSCRGRRDLPMDRPAEETTGYGYVFRMLTTQHLFLLPRRDSLEHHQHVPASPFCIGQGSLFGRLEVGSSLLLGLQSSFFGRLSGQHDVAPRPPAGQSASLLL